MKHIRWPFAVFLLALSCLIIAIADPFNTPPIFVEPQGTYIQAFTETPFELDIEVEDIDHDVLTVTAHNLPDWLTFDPYLVQLYGNPKRADKGDYVITIKADDGRVVRTKMISLEVEYGHSVQQHLDEAFSSLYEEETTNLLGASAAIITPDGALHTSTEGRSNPWNNEHVTPNHRYRMASISKLFTSALIMRLVEEGRLQLDDKLYDYLPLDGIPNAKEITIRELLSHTAGVIDHLNHPAFYRGNWKYRTWKPSDIHYFASRRRARFSPGKGYAYSNTGFFLLGELIEKILEKPLAEAYKEYIFDPLELKQTLYDDFSTRRDKIDSLAENARAYEYHQSAVGAAGSIVSTPSDIARFGHALFTGKLVSDTSLLEMVKDIGASVGGDHYGLGMRLWDDNGIIHMGHTGALMGYRAILMYLPEYDVTIALATNDRHYKWYGLVNGLMMEMADYYR
ncbi:MAG: serine hydrolase [Lewinellaceae bacterium]|nr:serine hydrolase [Lewinellaceae bacterium]MCB9290185.1 serine hydrolase [Lewinellaceae bacterium]